MNSCRKMCRLVIFACLAAFASAGNDQASDKLHQHMSHLEIQSIFGAGYKPKDEVPNHKVVRVSYSRHRSNHNHHLVKIVLEQPMTLYLEPEDEHFAGVNTPIYLASSDAQALNKRSYKRVPNVIKSSLKFYKDTANEAAVLLDYDSEGKPLLDGVFGRYAIRPLPERLRNLFGSPEGQSHSVPLGHSPHFPEMQDTHHHVMYEIGQDFSPEQLAKHDWLINDGNEVSKQKSSQVPGIVYPQILVVMDKSLFDVFSRKVDNAVKYVLSYWNGVDLRYRIFQQPRIRLNIAGVVLAEDAHAVPYIQENLMALTTNGTKDFLLERTTLRHKSKVLFAETRFDEADGSLHLKRLRLQFDMIVTMTAHRICPYPTSESALCVTLGSAYYTGACAYNLGNPYMESIGIIHDRGAFAGIIPTAHEVGHLLGASHNPHNKNNCPAQDGFLMSMVLNVTEDSFVWSNCSQYSIKDFLESEKRSRCLFNVPETGPQVKKQLPGKLLNRHKQCFRLTGSHACKINSCAQLFCWSKGRCVPVQDSPVPEGTYCGGLSYCINGACIPHWRRTVKLKTGFSGPV